MSVLIVGKGPSARPVPADEPAIVVALNGASRICGRVDYQVIVDHRALDELPPPGEATLVHPVYLQGDPPRHWFDDPRVLAYRARERFELPSAPERVHGVPWLGGCRSCGEAAVAWLLHQGHREFRTIGIDPEGGYSELFAGGVQRETSPGWYRVNWRKMQRRVLQAGGTIRRVA